jgi:hypothetical protein
MRSEPLPVTVRVDRDPERSVPMKAAVVHSFDRPLEIDDVPVPEPGAD